jgi:hypothetical protein
MAQELDGSVPKGPDWHRLLLEQMSLEIPAVRPRLTSRGSSTKPSARSTGPAAD